MYGFINILTQRKEPKKTNSVPKDAVREDKKMRQNISEKRIDKTLENSFPASDPPAWY